MSYLMKFSKDVYPFQDIIFLGHGAGFSEYILFLHELYLIWTDISGQDGSNGFGQEEDAGEI